MAIGERIHFFRNKRGMRRSIWGSFSASRKNLPTCGLHSTKQRSEPLNLALQRPLRRYSTFHRRALAVPDIDSYTGLMHTLFTLEDRYGLKINEADGEVCLRVDAKQGADAAKLLEMLLAWRQAAAMLASGEISREEYDRWRYFYPEFDTTGRWAKVPSQALIDTIMQEVRDGDSTEN